VEDGIDAETYLTVAPKVADLGVTTIERLDVVRLPDTDTPVPACDGCSKTV
jgi:hypothetical protein